MLAGKVAPTIGSGPRIGDAAGFTAENRLAFVDFNMKPASKYGYC
jgi:hypothetical protein